MLSSREMRSSLSKSRVRASVRGRRGSGKSSGGKRVGIERAEEGERRERGGGCGCAGQEVGE